MAEPFLAEIRMVAFNFAPRGWAFCEGQILPINQNQSLFSLLGTTYGGDGRTTFALPDLRARTPIHVDEDDRLGARGGAATHTLTVDELPAHTHGLQASGAEADAAEPGPNRLLADASTDLFTTAAQDTQMDAALSSVGGGQAHENRPPYLAINFVIALRGLFPARN